VKFYGAVGYGQNVESAPGVWTDVITETSYIGDVMRNTRRLVDGSKVNDDLTVGNLISIVADAYALENFFAMRYVVWNGTRWVVSQVEVQPPRLLLTLGGVYNGPLP
jgi:hypothetical protein